MAKLLRALLLFSVITAVCWLGVITYWQGIHLAPSMGDIALWLGLLPLSLIGLILLIAWLRRQPAPAATEAATEPAVAIPASQPHPKLNILASYVVTPLGDDGDTLREALATDLVPSLDTTLTDFNGFPLPARRHPDLDLDRQHDEDDATGSVRARALLVRLLDQCSAELGALNAGYERRNADAGAHRSAALLNPAWHGDVAAPLAPVLSAVHLPPVLKIQLLLDVDHAWSDADTAWLRQQVHHVGLAPNFSDVEVLPLSADALTVHLGRVVDTLAAHAAPILLLLLATVSHIDQQKIDRWLEQGKLGQGKLQFPGEAAAGLLLANTAVDWPDAPSIAQLNLPWRADMARSESSRSRYPEVLANLLQSLQQTMPLPNNLQWLCSGLALGPEAIEAAPLLAAAPEPRQIEEALHLRSAVGDAGVAGVLAAYALAAQNTVQSDAATMLVLNHGEAERGLCLLEPAIAPD